jgi:hypothetical protein
MIRGAPSGDAAGAPTRCDAPSGARLTSAVPGVIPGKRAAPLRRSGAFREPHGGAVAARRRALRCPAAPAPPRPPARARPLAPARPPARPVAPGIVAFGKEVG